jgi:hypothetical protein
MLSKKDARLIAKIMEISLEIVVAYQCSTKPPELLSFLASKHPRFLASTPPGFPASKHPSFLAI